MEFEKSFIIGEDANKDVLNGKGTKDDKGKPILTLTDPQFWIEVSQVMEAGTKKYKRGNWQLDLDPERILNALIRHSIKIWQGEVYDKETGLKHSAHIGCNAMFLNYCERQNKPVVTEHNKG